MSPSRRLASLLVLALAACGPSGSGDDDSGDGGACTAGQTQCVGTQFQTCVGGQFTTSENCAVSCDPTRGCRVCTPGVNACNGNDVVTCNPDGSFGGVVQA